MSSSSLPLRLAEVVDRIERAAARAGRAARDVRILAVTKGHPITVLHEALALGLSEFGENRVQEALPKIDALADRGAVHLIGPLQSNKVNKVVGRVASVMSVDRVELVDRLARRADELECEQPIWAQVNASGEARKSGCSPDALEPLVESVLARPSLRLDGLMTLARFGAPEIELRRTFATLRRLASVGGAAAGLRLGLSMGMSEDFEIAVEEGATVVRLGSALFGERPVAAGD